MHIQGVEVVALQEVHHIHLRIAARSHHQQVEDFEMDRPTSLRYHQGRRVKLFTNIEMMIRCEDEVLAHMQSVILLNQDGAASYESPFKDKESLRKLTTRLSFELSLTMYNVK